MILSRVAKQAEKFATDNSPAILTGVGVVGTLTVAYLSGKASFKAAHILTEEKQRRIMMNEPDMTRPDILKVTWKLYIPAAGTTALTIAAVVCSNQIGTRRTAAMAAAYTISDKAFQEYKEKIVEKIGENKERAARDELAQDRVNGKPLSNQVIIMGNGEVMCFDQPTGRYFRSNMENLRRIVNDLNQQIVQFGYGTLSDFYVMLGLTTTPYSEEVGWSTDDLCDLKFTATLSDDSQPCIAIDYQVKPIREYK